MIRMDNTRTPQVEKYLVPRAILRDSATTLRSLSGNRRESVILWIGTRVAEVALVKRIAVPSQIASSKHFEVPLRERFRIIRDVASSGEKLLVQLHTHPNEAFHSFVDDRIALPRHTGGISIVVANFGVGWEGDLKETSVNRHLGGGSWEELNQEAVTHLFEIQ